MRSALKCLSILFFLIFVVLLFKTPVFAAEQNESTKTTPSYLTPVTNPDVPNNLHTFTQSAFIEVIDTIYCQLAGYDPLSSNHKCLGIDTKTGKIGFVENGGGLIGITTNLMASTYVMPTNTGEYVNYLSSNFGYPKKAYAQLACANKGNGAGFCSISPLTSTWVTMRNIVYLLFTVIFVVIGVAIMLRVHIDPRTVMTLENQLPKIIVGIVLVTLSLAIAGFLIDIMYVAIYLIGNIFVNIANTTPGMTGPAFQTTYNNIVMSGSPIKAAGYMDVINIVHNVASGIGDTVSTNVRTIFDIPIIGDVGRFLLWLILFLIFLLAFWIAILRTWISLIVAYIMILLDIIFAPFWFIAGLLPGGSLGFGPWFRDILANLAVFPTTIAMYGLAIIFSSISGAAAGSPVMFDPPMVAGLGGVAPLAKLITFGFIFMTPQALSIVKSAIKAPKFNVGPVFAPAGAATGVVKSSVTGAFEARQTMLPPAGEKTGIKRVLMRRMG